MEEDGLEELVRQQSAKLERYFDAITSCRVIVEMRGRHRHGNLYHVRIDLGVPDGELVVKHEPSIYASLQEGEAAKAVKSGEVGRLHRHPRRAILDAFAEMRRRLQDYARTRRGKVKKHAETLSTGTVDRLFPGENYGFLTTPDSGQVYFHRDSVLSGHFDLLRIGSHVRFAEEIGEKGPQASTVRLVHPRKQAKAAAGVVVIRKRAPGHG
jgi:cold shock CspA family protein